MKHQSDIHFILCLNQDQIIRNPILSIQAMQIQAFHPSRDDCIQKIWW